MLSEFYPAPAPPRPRMKVLAATSLAVTMFAAVVMVHRHILWTSIVVIMLSASSAAATGVLIFGKPDPKQWTLLRWGGFVATAISLLMLLTHR
jgi:hypothetical protein